MLQLEEKNFDYIYQKDVNNYIAIKGDYMECKGGDVNRYLQDSFFRNNNARIVDIALVDNITKGKDIINNASRKFGQTAFISICASGWAYL